MNSGKVTTGLFVKMFHTEKLSWGLQININLFFSIMLPGIPNQENENLYQPAPYMLQNVESTVKKLFYNKVIL